LVLQGSGARLLLLIRRIRLSEFLFLVSGAFLGDSGEPCLIRYLTTGPQIAIPSDIEPFRSAVSLSADLLYR
jgi:hypothetical protein